jgi:hypothetical protein
VKIYREPTHDRDVFAFIEADKETKRYVKAGPSFGGNIVIHLNVHGFVTHPV